jgi:hypothetical protein
VRLTRTAQALKENKSDEKSLVVVVRADQVVHIYWPDEIVTRIC